MHIQIGAHTMTSTMQIVQSLAPHVLTGKDVNLSATRTTGELTEFYLHGTGHGVGTYLNVHEGPHQFRMEWKPAPLVAGMTITDEPGIYLADKFGVRIENTLLITPYKETEFGKFLQFESLTLCPIDKKPIMKEMLLKEEVDWLDAYHQRVFDMLSPHLSEDEKKWLRDACAPL